MRKLMKILALCAAVIASSSCLATLALTGVVLGNVVPGEKVTLKGRTTGQIGDSGMCAFLETDSGATVCIVYDFGTYKEGKRIRDRFVRAGLYKYTSDKGTELYAPVFIRKKDFKRLWPLAVQLDAGNQAEAGKGEVFI